MKNKGRLRVLRILVLFAIGKKHLLTVVSEMVNRNLVRKNELDGKEQRARIMSGIITLALTLDKPKSSQTQSTNNESYTSSCAT